MPQKISIYKDLVYQVDGNSRYIKTFTQDGCLVRQWRLRGTITSLWGITVANDIIFLVDRGRLMAYNLVGEHLFDCQPTFPLPGDFADIVAVDDTIFVNDWNNRTIHEFVLY